MIEQDRTPLTHQTILAATPEERVELIESHLLRMIRTLRPDAAETVTAATQLADIGIDSLQIVELKFSLDELVGSEVEIEVIIANPTIRELAQESLRRAGLQAC